MKVTAIDSAVLGGQGSIGSGSLTVANPAPGIGPSGGDAANANAVPSNAATAAVKAPMPSEQLGPSGEPTSQYSTIGPVPEG